MNKRNKYEDLSKDERLTLYLQAAARNDQQEVQAVLDASPKCNLKLVDFARDLHGLLVATLFQCLSQLDSFILIALLSMNLDKAESLRTAQLRAKHWVVSEQAWRELLEEFGSNYENVLNVWPSIAFVNSAFVGLIQSLAASEVRYEVTPDHVVILDVPPVEKVKEDHRAIIKTFTDLL
jgi:hypothetical protein